jgi:hypothetical protein
MSCARIFVMGFLLLVLTPGAARADWLFVPFFGANFGGDSAAELGDAIDASKFSGGVSFGWMGGGIFGLEGDVGYSPDFFGKTDAGGSSVLTLTGNLVLGVPFGGQSGFGVRPYAVVGVGVIRPEGDAFPASDAFGENKVTWDFGGGLFVFFTTHVGIRADVRYFRTFDSVEFLDLDLGDAGDSGADLDFTRGTIGFVVRF